MGIYSCCLCSQIGGNAEHDLVAHFLPAMAYRRRVIVETDTFAVIPSLGPITDGHVLLCPKDHLRSIAAIGSDREIEFVQAKVTVRGLLETVYCQPVHWFEHGMASGQSKISCTVEHAHLHAVPIDADVTSELSGFRRFNNSPPPSQLNSFTNGEEYLYYEAPSGEAFLATNDNDRFESQWFRKVFAAAAGQPTQWDWRQHPQPEMTHQIFAKLISCAEQMSL